MTVTAIHLVHKVAFEPVVRVDENVKLLAERPIFGRVTFVEPLQPQVIDLGALPAAAPAAWPAPGAQRELSELKLGEREFGQWRLLILDDFLLEVRLPAATGRFVTKAGPTRASRLSLAKEQLLELYTYRDTVPTVQPLNPNFSALEMSRLLVAGFRYVFEVLERAPKEYTAIPVYGVPTTGRR